MASAEDFLPSFGDCRRKSVRKDFRTSSPLSISSSASSSSSSSSSPTLGSPSKSMSSDEKDNDNDKGDSVERSRSSRNKDERDKKPAIKKMKENRHSQLRQQGQMATVSVGITHTCRKTADIVSSLQHFKRKVLRLMERVEHSVAKFHRTRPNRASVKAEIELNQMRKKMSEISEQITRKTRKLENEPVDFSQMEILIGKVMEYTNDTNFRLQVINRTFFKDR